MRMKKFFAVMLLMVMAFSTSALKAQQMGPIPVDEGVRIGKLDCGLTYYIRHNDYPEHRVNFYIAQRVGSIQEEESQRGLAHFLEHMAFNGSEHFNGEGKSIIDYTRSLGVAFGKDLNAYTSIDETVYNINDVPSTRESAIDSCLLILKDWSGGLLLTDEEIDKERGVIHEEWRMNQSGQMRLTEKNLEYIYPGSKYGKRIPIGLMSVVDNFPYQELRDYYHKWYRPDNQALVIVGDVDVDHIEAKIKELFKGLTLDPNAAQVVMEPVPDNDEPIIIVDQDKEMPMSQIQMFFKHDATPKEEKGDLSYLLEEYLTDLISRMFSARLSEKALEPDCPYTASYAADGNFLYAKTKNAFTVIGIPKPGQTEAATQALLTEAARAAQFGFTATEFSRANDEYMSELEKQYNERNNISNESYGRDYCRHYLDNEPIPSIEQRYKIMSMIAPYISVDMINPALPEIISTDGKNLVMVNYNQEKEGVVNPTVESMKAALVAAANANIEPYVDNVKQEPLISNMPKKGKIKKETVNNTLGFTDLELSNGAHVILKKTDFKDNEIQLMAFQRGGSSLYGEEDWANTEMMPVAMMTSGLGNFSNNELEKALAGKQASVIMGMDTYEDVLSGSTTVKDLETLFQLLYLNFTAINKDENRYNMFMGQIETFLKNKDLDPENVFNDSVDYTLGNHNWRSQPFDVNALKKVNYDRILQIVKERTANAANYTFIFVGAFDDQVIRPYIEQYIASLPGKKGKQSSFVDVATHPEGQVINHFTNKSETPKAMAKIYWYDTKTPYSLENQVKANILGEVLEKVYLQKIREDAGAAYSTGAVGKSTYEGNRFFTSVMGVCPVKPEMADMAVKIMNEEMVQAGNYIDPTTLKEIQELAIKDLNTNFKENDYWLETLHKYLMTGYDTHTGIEQIIKSQTPESIAAFARQLLSAGNKVEVVMLPEE